MSFKDVKDLGEHLKLIGYPKNIQLSIFCTNYGGPAAFSIIVEILRWLINRLEPSSSSSTASDGSSFSSDLTSGHEITKEQERVQFIRSVTEFLITKCGIKINPRKLYSSSFSSAKEILRVTNLLLNAPQNSSYSDQNKVNQNDDDDDDMNLKNLSEISESKINELRKARELSSDLTNHGAILYDLLKKEISNKEIRNSHANRSIELAVIEKTIKLAISNLENNLKLSKEKLEQIKSDKINISNKVERKLSELERSKHRLEALKKVRPAYLDEFNKYEEELKELFSQYILRIRCVDSLKAQLLNSSNQRTPTPTNIPIVRPSESTMNAMFLNDENGILDTDDSEDDDDDDDDDDDNLDDDDIKMEMTSGDKFNKIGSKLDKHKRINSRRMPPSSLVTSTIPTAFLTEERPKKRVTMRDEINSDIELDSTFNSDEEDSVLAELGAENLMDMAEDVDSLSKLTRDPPIGAQSDEDF